MESLVMNRKGLTLKLEVKEVKILSKILGRDKENGEYRGRHNHEFDTQVEKMVNTIRKKNTV